MTQLRLGLRAATFVLVVGLEGCGGGTVEEPRPGGEAAAASSAPPAAARDVRACAVLDLAAATRIIGQGTEHPGGDTEAGTCMYVNPGVATLTFQLGPAGQYDQITILQPHTPVEIGERGRYNVDGSVVAVQFVKGAYSATLSARPISRSQSDYLQPALSGAREVAGRLP